MGHVPPGTSIEAVIAAGARSVEHANVLAERGLARAALESEAELQRELVGWRETTGQRLARAMLASRTALVPTLAVHREIIAMAEASPDAFPAGFVSERTAIHSAAGDMSRMLRDLGVTVLAGSDCSEATLGAAHALHAELGELVAAGWTPAEALASATLGPAEFFGRSHELGRIAPGYLADFFLIAEDPIGQIENLRDVRGAWVGGLWALPGPTPAALLANGPGDESS